MIILGNYTQLEERRHFADNTAQIITFCTRQNKVKQSYSSSSYGYLFLCGYLMELEPFHRLAQL